jgi:hypothetical protein
LCNFGMGGFFYACWFFIYLDFKKDCILYVWGGVYFILSINIYREFQNYRGETILKEDLLGSGGADFALWFQVPELRSQVSGH